MGAVRIWVQTSDKNITIIIQTTAAHQLMSWEVKSCVFVINVLTSNQSSILHIALSSEKDSLSESRYAQIKLRLQVKTVIWEDNGGDALMIDWFNWWTGVLWIIVMFLSDSHSDGTHSLQSIRCWDTDAMLHFYKSDEETNSSSS